jgi:outer membrane protein TolC
MKRNRIVFSLILAVFQAGLVAQSDSLTLLQCLTATRSNALIKPQIETYNELAELEVSNRSATNLPGLSAYGKAWYQSDAVTVSTAAGPYLEIDKFQYNVGIEANQKIYDGGMAKRGKALDKAVYDANIDKVETELYQINFQVMDYFFRSALLEHNREVLELKEATLVERLDELESAYKNGMISRAELGKIRAELLSTGQDIMEIEKLRSQTISALQILTGLDIDTNTSFVVSGTVYQFSSSVRPENRYFDSELLKLEKMTGLNSVKNLPKLYAFGQAGYSYPGLNYFENQSDYYYMVGARLSWTIFDWNQNKRNNQIIRKQEGLITSKRDEFNQKMELATEKEMIEQEELLQIMKLDKEIIDQRTLVSNAGASALENGTITTASYLEDLNAEIIARLKLETHKIQYQSSLARSFLIKGIDLETHRNIQE